MRPCSSFLATLLLVVSCQSVREPPRPTCCASGLKDSSSLRTSASLVSIEHLGDDRRPPARSISAAISVFALPPQSYSQLGVNSSRWTTRNPIRVEPVDDDAGIYSRLPEPSSQVSCLLRGANHALKKHDEVVVWLKQPGIGVSLNVLDGPLRDGRTLIGIIATQAARDADKRGIRIRSWYWVKPNQAVTIYSSETRAIGQARDYLVTVHFSES